MAQKCRFSQDGASPCEVDGTVASEYSGLTDEERYLFDVHGIVILRGVLSREEAAAARAAVDRTRARDQVRGSVFIPTSVHTKMIVLPRQALDKHSVKTSKKERCVFSRIDRRRALNTLGFSTSRRSRSALLTRGCSRSFSSSWVRRLQRIA